jgi:Uma2 family endonuclease
MTTATELPLATTGGLSNGTASPASPVGEDDSRFVFRRVDWEFYQGLLALIGERRYRVTYDQGSLELMAPSWNHEWWSHRLDRTLTGIGGAVGRDFVSGGSTTFSRRDLDRGLEPDQCYYTVNAHRMLGPRILDLSVDPPPDLAIEVDFTSSSLDRLGIYAALGVPEVWRWDATGLHVYHLQGADDSPKYVSSDLSLSFPTIPVDRIVDFILATQSHADLRLIQAAHDWAEAGFPAAGDPPPPAVN